MKHVYICSACRGDYERNMTAARRYCRQALEACVIPIAPHLYFTQFLNDADPDDRALGMSAGLELLKLCSEVWVFGEPSEGMLAEIAAAHELGLPMLYKRGM